ncbi:F-box family protein [Rhynchospora pubera]|uniref:F-box family protein n=1 Tax=Rhynchospora pubera TaxID=906938 RepID=A0AAV8HPS8_9POAL|nr:F-box family protein [Rhynchospora pubera]
MNPSQAMEEEAVDRISSLPKEIRISILCRLEIKDAVRTSALAKSWRHLWTLLPRLRLGCYLDRLGYPPSRGFPPPLAPSLWIKRVHHLVSSLRGPLLDFELSHYFRVGQSPLLQSLFDLLLKKGGGGVHSFTFSSHHGFPKYHDCVLLHLPSFPSLKQLTLYGCRILLPPGFPGFPHLTTLKLQNVFIFNDDLNLLINPSYNLTTLVMLDCASPKNPLSVNISLPLLTHLEFQINKYIKKVSVNSAPCLEEARISVEEIEVGDDSRLQKLARVTLGLLTSVATVTSLCLDNSAFKYLSVCTLPISFTFPRLRRLKLLLSIAFMDKRMCDVFLWLLRSMPFLEELEWESLHSTWTESDAVLMRELFLKRQDGLSCLDQTLKRVTMNMIIWDVMTSTTVVKFFLLNANVLELMKIVNWSSEVEASMIEELQKAKVTCSNAKVVICFHKEDVTINFK